MIQYQITSILVKTFKMKNFLVRVIIIVTSLTKATFCFDPLPPLSYAVRQYTLLSQQLSKDAEDSGFITSGNPLNPFWDKNDVSRWTVGFYGGSLWTLYKLTLDNYWRNLAEEFQERVKSRQFDTSTHDVGFVIGSTFGLCWKYTGNLNAIPVIIQASTSLASRYYPPARVLRSWNNDAAHGGVEGEVKVIADNMMNLEMLIEASKLSGNQTFLEIALSHANRTIEEHFRRAEGIPDGSTFHVVAYNESSGDVQRKYNWQGLRDNSTWSRALSWIIHGYSTTYQETNETYPMLLEYAEIAANYFITRLPEDLIPYWDFDADFENSHQPRDTSCAAVAAHAFLKLFTLTKNQTYFNTAESILENLVSDKYRSDGKIEYTINSLFVNGTVFYHEGNFNTAIVYGDFYYLQALALYIDLTKLME